MTRLSIYLLCLIIPISYGSNNTVVNKSLESNATELVFKIDLKKLRGQLNKLSSNLMKTNKSQIELIFPNGEIHSFLVKRKDLLSPELQAKYPEITTYDAWGINHPNEKGKFDLTPKGFHGMIMEPGEKNLYIDPLINSDSTYSMHSLKISKLKPLNYCGAAKRNKKKSPIKPINSLFALCDLKIFRIIIAGTSAYTQHYGGDAGATAAQITSLNRINGIYERDVAVTFYLLSTINFLEPYPNEPYTDVNDANILGPENQVYFANNVDPFIYDVAQVFSYRSDVIHGNGVAGFESVCSNDPMNPGYKAFGASVFGTDNIASDNVFAHELGHQFSADHTQNVDCNRGIPGNSVETGTGVTLMSYGDTFCIPSVQNFIYSYFHSFSVQQINNFADSIYSPPNACGISSLSPPPTPSPIINSTNGNSVIPINTPFSLTAEVTPNTGISYNWEQMNSEITLQPPTRSAIGGPNFRNFELSASPIRYFPNLTDLANGGPFTWEALPSVSRILNFRLAVRQENVPVGVGSCNTFADVTVTSDANSGPFLLTYPNQTNITWRVNENKQITWNVANTANLPVNATLVNVLLSIDDGATYPYTLATNVPNTGNANITVPNINTTTARIIVMEANQRFFTAPGKKFTIKT